MDIGDCNSEFLMSLSEDNPCRLTLFSTHSLSYCNSTMFCTTKTTQAMNTLNEEKLGTAPDNLSMSDINDITASTQGKIRSDTEQFRKFQRNVSEKCRSWTSISFNSANINYTSHTHYWLPKHKSDGNAHYSLEDSATELFLPHWRSDKNKQSNAQWHAQQWQQDSMTN